MAARGKKDGEPETAEEGEPSDRPRPRTKASEEGGGVLGALSAGLDEIVPGLEILDRELVFEQGGRADIAAVDPSGRLHLVLLAGEDSDRAVLDALDALAFLRTHLELLVRHFGERRVNPERAARVFVVSPSADERLIERLAALADAGVLVLGLRTVKSAGGERSYLVRLEPRGRAPSSASGVAAFLRTLPVKLEPLGHALVERIGDVLQASVAPRHEPLALADPSDLEELVEKALARLVRVLGMTRAERPASGARAPFPGGQDEPLLTPEEIQAFRE